MKFVVVLLSIFLAWKTVSSFPELLGSSRIFGGRTAKVGEFPFQVSLQNNDAGYWTHMCGASIIDERHILTAAHCFMWISSPDQLLVVAGELNVNDTEEPSRVVREVEQYYKHKDFVYDEHVLKDDICLIRVKEDIPFNSVIEAIPMRTESLVPPAMCSISGWGAMAVDGVNFVYPDVLQALGMPYVDYDSCVAHYANFTYEVLPGMVCSGYLEGGPNPCFGDSGGGLICNGQLTGITSWNRGCWNETYVTVFTDVSYYRGWIEEHLALSRKDGGLQ